MQDLILIGGGSHCHACIDVIENDGNYSVRGIVDMPERVGQKVMNYPIFASDDDLEMIASKNKNFLITIGHLKDATVRFKRFEELKSLGANFPSICSPISHVSKHASIDEGTLVMHGAIVNTNAKIGKNCIINTGSIVEHDVTIGDHTHVSTSSVINGGVTIGSKVMIGSNSTILPGVTISDDVVIGAGAVVTESIESAGVYVGVPAKEVCRR